MPKFSGQSWLAFPVLRAAYKHIQLEIEFRPESWDGVLFLTGERDDLAGDFVAIILHEGFVEFRSVLRIIFNFFVLLPSAVIIFLHTRTKTKTELMTLLLGEWRKVKFNPKMKKESKS